jgi:hypothetical protein
VGLNQSSRPGEELRGRSPLLLGDIRQEPEMSKETPKDDPRHKTDQGSHTKTDKPWIVAL